MDLGHGFIPRVDARNYKAVERCMTGDGPRLFHEALDVPWAVLEGPWALQHGAVKVVQRRLGHASATETLDTYSDLWPDSEDRTATLSTWFSARPVSQV